MPIDLACTGCRRSLSIRDEFAGRQVRCPACGAMVLAAQPSSPPEGALLPGFAGPFFAPPVPMAPPAPTVEWEDATKPHGPGALLRTWGAVLFSPSRFFSMLAQQGPVSRALLAGLPCLVLGAASAMVQSHLVTSWIFTSLPSEFQQLLSKDDAASYFRNQLLMEAMGFAIYPLALHAGVAVFGGKGIRQTFRIYYYSLISRLMDLIPLGFLVSVVYLIILLYLGTRNLHGLSGGRSLGALLVAIFIALMCYAIIMGCMMLTSPMELPALH